MSQTPATGCRCRILATTRDGWVCPDCDYTQGWAYAEMADDA